MSDDNLKDLVERIYGMLEELLTGCKDSEEFGRALHVFHAVASAPSVILSHQYQNELTSKALKNGEIDIVTDTSLEKEFIEKIRESVLEECKEMALKDISKNKESVH